MQVPTQTPVLVGVAQRSDTTSAPGEGMSPLQALAEVARLAAADTGTRDPAALLRELDAVTVIRLFSDTIPRFKSPFGSPADPPGSLARRLGAQPRHRDYAPAGGDSPQTQLAKACRRIATGEASLALVAGAEALRTELAARRAGIQLDWSDGAATQPPPAADAPLRYYTRDEERHGMRSASAMYGLIAHAMRHAKGLSPAHYTQQCAELFARFAAVARNNPYATRRAGYDARAIATAGGDNPMVGTPYPKLMTASAFVDQAAAVLVCSEERAHALGIPPSRWVYLQGAAAARDPRCVSERDELVASVAMRLVARQALARAGRTVAEVDTLDLYSCFPSAVQAACDALGVAEDDPRGLTVTGGLSFFGGPGNNYSMHAIAETVQRLRRAPGTAGLVLANGGPLTNQAVGVYSTQRSTGAWLLEPDTPIQDRLDRLPQAVLDPAPAGRATVETLAVLWDRNGPQQGLLFGRTAAGRRFVARLDANADGLRALGGIDATGLPGVVTRQDGINLFRPDGFDGA